MDDLIRRSDAILQLLALSGYQTKHDLVQAIEKSTSLENGWLGGVAEALDEIEDMPEAKIASLYEYHYDHTDCIWYRPEARNRCPATCAQYRDGWNDAMLYIFRDGKGYRPYKRDEQYGE